jgi:hypothetical protein
MIGSTKGFSLKFVIVIHFINWLNVAFFTKLNKK